VIDLLAGIDQVVPQKSSREIDLDNLADAIAHAIARDISDNLSTGKKPDGSGVMPIGITTGKPRGIGSDTARSIHAVDRGKGNYLVVAIEDDKGTLARILRGVPLAMDPKGKNLQAVRAKAAEIAEK
jgi:hypothetical protein